MGTPLQNILTINHVIPFGFITQILNFSGVGNLIEFNVQLSDESKSQNIISTLESLRGPKEILQ